MWGLSKRILINFVQCRLYRQDGKLLLLLAAFFTLSLILSVVGTGGMAGNLPVLLAQTEDLPMPLGGPPVVASLNGTLAHEGDSQRVASRAEVSLRGFDIEVRFFNPLPTPSEGWAHMVGFGQQDNLYAVAINSKGQWVYYSIVNLSDLDPSDFDPSSPPLGQGTSGAIDTSESGSNLLKLMVHGNTGSFYINNQLVTTLDLSRPGQAGALFEIVVAPPLSSSHTKAPEVNLRGFDIEARFFNPLPTPSEGWAYGFWFGLQGNSYTVSINSKGQWQYHLQNVDAPPLGQGTSGAIDTSESGSNLLKLTVHGNTGSFYINNQLVTTLDLSHPGQAGALFEIAAGLSQP
jgi:hypothetical protein